MIKKKLILTSAMAATLSTLGGCSGKSTKDGDVVAERDTAVCVDQNGTRVEDSRCGNPGMRSGGGGMASAFLWYYVGRGGLIPHRGDNINDPNRGFNGSHFASKGTQYAAAPASTNVVRSPATSRAGFGSSGSKFASSRS
ncbi:MAG: hypothetical protein B7Y36_01210 [Novosphingobium sp. 28-62-57]|uniref:hypothetical protein n=1 Tax=unclassified Novosphingobium TaxID=2644732 RepID=UPI000BC96809|nr:MULTISPECIES: hypothetical protein [unclassified Novosphingobium]OYW50040.1 MAG: hypothetical protein B7Z34_07220 [Novosphingobium sp. 12-62-10]OYZ12194.1 MAG: hypothetical protein B7Y36_01210 [Novosphingobium sp. 28-62-57]OZA36079.1 MAG: hypothetical protein B7X92_07890 [Novosphingobium sp. 17-62-9]HQS70174.1 hypothetical protein [Novosphingobium sp.]